MRKLTQLVIVAVLTLLCSQQINAQDIDFTIRFDEANGRYEVYAKPDFDDPYFFVAGGNQLTIVLPNTLPDFPLAIQTVNGGFWVDNSQIYAPVSDADHDFHGIASNGSGVTFVNGEELLLFTFTTPDNACVSNVRLFENNMDPQSNAPGMMGGDFNNYFANVFNYQNYYRDTYNNLITCLEPPQFAPDSLIVLENTVDSICLTITDPNVGDTFTFSTCNPTPSNGTAVTTLVGDQLCIVYTPNTDFFGFDEICLTVCDQGNLCSTEVVPIRVISPTCLDVDMDNVCDVVDNCINIYNPNQEDCDTDGIGDVCETDTDGDTIPDDCDLCTGDDATGDTDGDGICDDIDNCLFLPNPTQADCDTDGEGDICELDADADGIPDACDVCLGDDASGDTDGDDICDDIDNCINVPNADQADCNNDGIGDLCETDTDGDSIPDNCDVCLGDDATGDIDGDGICDDIDNCINTSNPNQEDCDNDGEGNICESDSDNDGVADGCDVCIGNDLSGDTDADGICDNIDNCINIPNPAQADCNNDGIGNACEPDADADGVPDGCDLCIGNDALGDDDGDGICNSFTDCQINDEVAIDNDGEECVQPFTDVQLNANLLLSNADPDLYTFNWSGVDGFSSANQNPIIPNIQNEDAGTYTVTVTNTSTLCEFILSTVVDVTVIPIEPQINASAALVCIGGEYHLSIPQYNGTEVYYNWIGPNGTTNSGAYPDQATLTIDNFTNNDAGTYQVRVTVDGCNSLISAPITVGVQPTLQAPNIIGDNEVCQNSMINLSTDVVADEYIWTGPNGFTSNLQNPPVTISAGIQHEGDYHLVVVLNDCTSPTSTMSINLSQFADDPVLQVASSICNGNDIELSVVGLTAASYQWIPPSSTPNGPFGTLGDPNNVLWTTSATTNISIADHPDLYESGEWRVQVLDANGCLSEVSLPQTVTINEPPAVAIISAEGDVCEFEPIYLHASPMPNVVFKWYDGDPAGTPAGTLVATGQDPIIFNPTPGLHQYYAMAERFDCEADSYATVDVLVKEKPTLNTIANAGPFCQGENILLGTEEIQGAIYNWYGPNGYTSNAQNPIITNPDQQMEGTYLLFIEINGCASDPLSTQVVINPQMEVPVAINDGPSCIGSDLLLSVTNPNPALNYEWFESIGNISIGFGAELLIPNVNVSHDGTYYVVAADGNCLSNPSISNNAGENAFTTVIIDQADSDAAYVGENLFACESSIEVNALPTTTGTGIWTVLNSNANTTVLQPGQASSLVVDLEEGINKLLWSVTSNSCGTISSDTLIIEWHPAPIIAQDDFRETAANEPLTILMVGDNDLLDTDAYVIEIISDVENGTLSQIDNKTLSYYPEQGFIGIETFQYRICQEHCPDVCDIAMVTIRVAGEGCEVASVMTPNGDGYNDTFIVTCAFEFPGSEVSIFNRWGDEIFYDKDYKNSWDGTYKDEVLPTGTYFYNLKLNDGQGTNRSGYIYIEK